jgi:hypothetical protein
MFSMCVIFGPYHKPTHPQPSSPSYATHLEFYFYLSQIGTKPQVHKTKLVKLFCMCVIFGPYHKPTQPQPSSPSYATHLRCFSTIGFLQRIHSKIPKSVTFLPYPAETQSQTKISSSRVSVTDFQPLLKF